MCIGDARGGTAVPIGMMCDFLHLVSNVLAFAASEEPKKLVQLSNEVVQLGFAIESRDK